MIVNCQSQREPPFVSQRTRNLAGSHHSGTLPAEVEEVFQLLAIGIVVSNLPRMSKQQSLNQPLACDSPLFVDFEKRYNHNPDQVKIAESTLNKLSWLNSPPLSLDA